MMPSTRSSPGFLTDNLSLAAFLKACGHDPTPQPSVSGRVMFTFARSPQLDADIAAFTSNTAAVSPQAYDVAKVALRRDIDTVLGVRR